MKILICFVLISLILLIFASLGALLFKQAIDQVEDIL